MGNSYCQVVSALSSQHSAFSPQSFCAGRSSNIRHGRRSSTAAMKMLWIHRGISMVRKFSLLSLIICFSGLAYAQSPATSSPPDLSKEPTLYVVGYAHLDTEWRWEYPQVIREYLSKTMRSNFALFEKYPHYIFNFSGANRYRLMKEYYPTDFLRLKHYVAAGRWFPAGSSMEEG